MQQSQQIDLGLEHNVILKARKELEATGVKSVVSYDDRTVVLETQQGTLQIGGEQLSVSEFSAQSGEVTIGGKIEYLQYSAPKQEKKGFWGRLIR